jgi:hypothetical protein
MDVERVELRETEHAVHVFVETTTGTTLYLSRVRHAGVGL